MFWLDGNRREVFLCVFGSEVKGEVCVCVSRGKEC